MTLAQAIKLARKCIIMGVWAESKPRLLDNEWVVRCVRHGDGRDSKDEKGWVRITVQPIDMFRSYAEFEAFVYEAHEAERAAREATA